MAEKRGGLANAPLVKKEFANRSTPPPKPAPVSKLELKKLEAQRSKPAPAPPPPAPMKSQAPIVQQQQTSEREARIKHIEQRLAAQKGRAKESLSKAR